MTDEEATKTEEVQKDPQPEVVNPDPAPETKSAMFEGRPNVRQVLEYAIEYAIDDNPNDGSELSRKYANLIDELRRVYAMTNTMGL